MNFNQITLAGNLTRAPELKHIPSGTAVCETGIAVNDRVKRGDEWVDTPMFMDVVLWGRTAEVAAEYLSKGSAVLLSGKIVLEQWEKDGQKRSKHKMNAHTMQMLGSKGENPGRQVERPETQTVKDEPW